MIFVFFIGSIKFSNLGKKRYFLVFIGFMEKFKKSVINDKMKYGGGMFWYDEFVFVEVFIRNLMLFIRKVGEFWFM